MSAQRGRVPYCGVWSRLSLVSAEGRDERTWVNWVQGPALYVDLRIPADRPACAGAAALEDLDTASLRWLAGQQGFAGHLESTGGLCYWHRHLDLEPPAALPDAGAMQAEADGLVVEKGVFADYVEHWRLDAPWGADSLALKFLVEGVGRENPLRQGFLVALPTHFAFALERAAHPGRLPELFRRAHGEGERAALLEVLDCEISVGRREAGGGPWRIGHSSLPWREGSVLLEAGAPPAAEALLQALGASHPALRGRRLHAVQSEPGGEYL